MHATDQAQLENICRHGIRHLAISNYYPSAPWGPDTRLSDFRLRQHWPARRNGEPLPPPINWNELITWQDELDEPNRSDLPFTDGPLAYSSIPEGVIFSPNAEHHSFTNSGSHICSPGSRFASGSIDPQGRKYKFLEKGYSVGFGGSWEEAFAGMIEHLVYPDGGGIVINHPTWFSKLPEEQVHAMLDFDDGVLGIEVYNDYSGRKDWSANPNYQSPDEEAQGFSLNFWDRILATGRRCWGSCVQCH